MRENKFKIKICPENLYAAISHKGVLVGVLIGGPVIYFRVWY